MTTRPGDDPWVDRLSLALDDELAADERTLLDAHLAQCAGCRQALAELRAIVAQARALPDRMPAEDLWPGIESRIAAFARIEDAPDRPARPARFVGRGLTVSWPQLVAAGLLLVALSGGGVWLALHRGAAGGAAGGGAAGTEVAHDGLRATDDVQNAGAHAPLATDPAYAREVADLERALADRRGQLDPTTVKTIESNLHIIDLATAQARQALAADPSNPYLKDYLSRSMQRKVDVLKQATVYASTP